MAEAIGYNPTAKMADPVPKVEITPEAEPAPEVEKSPRQIVQLFRSAGLPLESGLAEMLEENPEFQTSRRGCGFTHATRRVSEMVAGSRRPENLGGIFDHSLLADWDEELYQKGGMELSEKTDKWTFVKKELLENILAQTKSPAGKLFVRLLMDILEFRKPDPNLPSVEPIKSSDGRFSQVGNCTTAEIYFYDQIKPYDRIYSLSVGDSYGSHKINYVVDESGDPIFIEKVGLGDDHSAISLKPIQENGVEIPAGSLFALEYDDDASRKKTRADTGSVIPLPDLKKARFLRFTPLVTEGEDRLNAFGKHIEMQQHNGFYQPETISVADFTKKAKEAIV
ncbi:MAG: hypothetical protein A2538_03305 [Candidatus Magasanikbacteria bacterium RIFOXYD2_FULL_41_14]|uniref:Uncharacterized protein n=1 Tax=Candidatus Magasanikbacteria bacterium RIFOXYD2_FULL_41_14 TaxID=1798709 RepID=A0A1F6PD14_9BACT|nr:MAG: hypothetical protein A2538_03305 [Candidatus Magasanikbacteria bacterium RIFOXYD2_FULL_41_14]